MAKKIVIANWKMNPADTESARALFLAIKNKAKKTQKIKTIIAPPFIYIPLFSKEKKIGLGAQDVFWQTEGAHTGEISAGMLENLNVSHVILGHSERRSLGETDEMVSKKLKAVIKAGMTAVVCVGEKERDTHGNYLSELSGQIRASLSTITKKDLKKVIVAYEPIWAIGKFAKEAIDAHKLHETVIYIRKIISEMFGKDTAKGAEIIYGGSVDQKNTKDLIKNGTVSGLLVGRASLDPKVFGEIILEVAKS